MNKRVDILSWIGNRIGKPPGWERVVRLFASPEKCQGMAEVCVVRDGMMFIAQPYVPLGWHVVFFGTYEPEIREIFRTILTHGGVAMDIGANVGWHTLLMAYLVGDRGRVIAAEANPSVRSRLEDHLKLNGFGRVEVLPYAIGDVEGTVEFYGPEADDPCSGDGHIVTAGAESGRSVIHVETHPLDAIVLSRQVERLDLIKVDVEGFEWPVLQGAEQTIAKFRPHIIFEYNADYVQRGGGNAHLLAEYFTKQGYRLFSIKQNWAEAVEPGNWPRCADIWAVPR